jgi:hypothetical protein
MQAVAEARDGSGNRVDRGVIWSSSNPAIAAVSEEGRVAGVSAGGPVTITATVAGQPGSAQVTVADDSRFGYAFADQQSATAPYTPSAALRFNSSTGAIQITRSATGTYQVRFAGLGRRAGQRDNVQVSAVGTGAGYCKTGGWQSTGADLVVDVRCFMGNGQLVDHRFTVLLIGARALPGRVGFVLASDAAGNVKLNPETTHSSYNLSEVGVQRDAQGVYEVFLAVPRLADSGAETVLVTATGTGPERCMVLSWDEHAGMAQVNCTATDGSGIDTPFSVLWIERGRPAQRTAFTWANEGADNGDFTPDPRWSMNSAGGRILEKHPALGQYQVLFGGLTKTAGATETVLVTVTGNPLHRCAVASWSNSGASDLQVSINCFGLNGGAADSKFDVLVIQ